MPVQSVLTLCTADQLVAQPVTWVVDRLIPAGMLTVLSGKDKMGKTLFAWELARAVRTNQPFLGQFPVNSGQVLYLALDDPATITIDRLEQLGLRGETGLHVATPLGCQPRSFTFWNQVTEQARSIRPALIVVDALYLFLQGGADALNQAGSMAPVMNPLNQLAEEAGVSVLLITHNSKSTGDIAGSFVIRAAAKQILRLTKAGSGPYGRKLTVEGKLMEETEWDLEFHGPGDWRLSSENAANLTQVRTSVSGWLQQGNRGSIEEIARAIARRTVDVRTAVRLLELEELLLTESVSRGGLGRPAQVYSWNNRPIVVPA